MPTLSSPPPARLAFSQLLLFGTYSGSILLFFLSFVSIPFFLFVMYICISTLDPIACIRISICQFGDSVAFYALNTRAQAFMKHMYIYIYIMYSTCTHSLSPSLSLVDGLGFDASAPYMHFNICETKFSRASPHIIVISPLSLTRYRQLFRDFFPTNQWCCSHSLACSRNLFLSIYTQCQAIFPWLFSAHFTYREHISRHFPLYYW